MRHPPGGPLAAGAAVAAVQGVALLGVAGFLFVRSFGNDVEDRQGAFLGSGLAVLGAAVLLLGAAGLARGRAGWRTPVLVLELLALPVAWGLYQSGLWPLTLLLAGGAVATLLLLLHPSSSRQLGLG